MTNGIDYYLYEGDAKQTLATFADESVQSCVTSPPYWGLRDYGTASWEGGDATCDHRHETTHQKQGASSQRAGRANAEAQRNENYRDVCGKCGAHRVDQQIGLESSPDAYVAALVAVFREVKRVLRDDGTLWLNLGDSYANDTKWGGSSGGKHSNALHGKSGVGRGKRNTGLKSKDLVGIPWMVAFALRADGWYLRSDIIWAKPNPMPESVKDRPTRSHEYVFLLTKSAKYYYDQGAIAEPAVEGRSQGNSTQLATAAIARTGGRISGGTARSTLGVSAACREGKNERSHRRAAGFNERWDHTAEHAPTRNARSVWTITPKPYAEAHFATFPPELARRCLLAGTRPGDVVIDPFAGSGTVGEVAVAHGRIPALIELNPAYHPLIEGRLTAGVGARHPALDIDKRDAR